MKHKTQLAIILIVFVGIASVSDFFGNVWSLCTARGFIIPKESSLLTFKATVLNQGSGEWWLYGEDRHFFYYFIGTHSVPYLKIAKADRVQCPGFDALNYLTWCQESGSCCPVPVRNRGLPSQTVE